MGAFILYSIEYKIEAPMLDGNLDFVFNRMQNRGSHAGWEPLLCIQLNTQSGPPGWMGALILYSFEYKIEAPMLDGILDFVFD